MTKQKILITGANGMLGRTLIKVLSTDYEIIATDVENGDITDYQGFRKVVEEERPNVIIHCAAMTAVDACESQPEKAYLLNAQGTKNVALAAQEFGCRLIYISTDYVFDGCKSGPYTESDKAGGAQTVYGRTKWQGEQSVIDTCPNYIIARISWLYGPGGPSFVHTMLKLADGTHPTLKVVNDQIGNPTSTYAVANKLKEILSHPELTGIFHMSCEGVTSWYDFARKIFEIAGVDQKVEPCSSDEYKRPAKRPHNSAMEKKALREAGLSPMPNWQDSLRDFYETGL